MRKIPFVLALLVQPAVAEPVMRVELARGSPVAASAYGVLPERDGGFLVSAVSTAGGWLMRYDAAGQLLARSRVARAGSLHRDSVGGLVITENLDQFSTPPDQLCRIEETAEGTVRGLVSGVFDAGTPYGAFVGTVGYTHGGSNPLQWFDRDCRPGYVGDLSVSFVAHDPAWPAAYVGSSPDTITYLESTGPRWSITGVDLVGVDGEGSFAIERGSRAILRIQRDGIERWRMPPGGATARVAGGLLLLVHAAGSAWRVEAIEPDGRTRWTTLTPDHPGAPIVTPPGARFLAFESGGGVLYFDARTGRARRTPPHSVAWPLAALDRTRVISRTGDLGLSIWHANGANAGVDLSVPGIVAPVALRTVDADTLVALVHEKRQGLELVRMRPNGQRAWSQRIPDLAMSLYDPATALVVMPDRACVFVPRSSLGAVLQCFEPSSGTPLFERLVFDMHRRSLRVVTSRNGVYVISGRTVHANGAVTGFALDEDTIGRDGSVRRRTIELAEPARQFAMNRNGDLLVSLRDRVVAITRERATRWEYPFDPTAFTYAQPREDDGAMILSHDGTHWNHARLDADGRVRWRRSGDLADLQRFGPESLLVEAVGTTQARVTRIDESTGAPVATRLLALWPDWRLAAVDFLHGRRFTIDRRDEMGFGLGRDGLPDATVFDAQTLSPTAVIPGALDVPRNGVAAFSVVDLAGHLVRVRAQVDTNDSSAIYERFD